MVKKLTFIEEAEFKGFRYRPNGILGNGFYGNGMFVSLSDMEKYSKTYTSVLNEENCKNAVINSDFFIDNEGKDYFYTTEIIKLFPQLKEHDLHNFLNRYKDVFLSQKLFSLSSRKREFTKEAVIFIYKRLIKKEETVEKKRGRRAS